MTNQKSSEGKGIKEVISPSFGVDPNKTVRLGGYTFIEYHPRKYLSRLSSICKWVLRPEVIHKPAKIMIFKDNGVYSLDCDDKVKVINNPTHH